jgi:hypothetical protein
MSAILMPQQLDKEGGIAEEDPSSLFASVFGGERFHDYVRPRASFGPERHTQVNYADR